MRKLEKAYTDASYGSLAQLLVLGVTDLPVISLNSNILISIGLDSFANHAQVLDMEIQSNNDKGRVVFLRLDTEMYEQLEQLREQVRGRGIATVIKMIVESALTEGITVAQEPRVARNKKRDAA